MKLDAGEHRVGFSGPVVGHASRCRARGRSLGLAGGRHAGGALWWRKNPSACPYGQRFWVRGAAPGHHAQAAARGPRAAARASGCSRSARAPATTRSTSPPRLDGGTLDDLRHPAGDAGPRRCARPRARASRTSSRRSGDAQQLPYEDDSFDGAVPGHGAGRDPRPGCRRCASSRGCCGPAAGWSSASCSATRTWSPPGSCASAPGGAGLEFERRLGNAARRSSSAFASDARPLAAPRPRGAASRCARGCTRRRARAGRDRRTRRRASSARSGSPLALAARRARPRAAAAWLAVAALVPRRSASTTVVKRVVRRARPRLRGLPPIGRAPATFSFPSGTPRPRSRPRTRSARSRRRPHARCSPRPALMALTRPYLGVHYPSDVLAGARSAARSGVPAQQRDEGRHRRPAERGQVDALQRAHAGAARRRPSIRSRPSTRTSRSCRCPTSGSTGSATRSGSTGACPEHIEFVDIAGLVRGAHKGEGLGNRFLGHIRDVDAILHVVRAFEKPQVAHPHGEVRPASPTSRRSRPSCCWRTSRRAERRLEAARRLRAAATRTAVAARRSSGARSSAELRPGRPAPPEAGLLTSKPALVVANVGEGEALPAALARARRRRRLRARRGGARRARARRRRPRCAPSSGSSVARSSEVVRAAYELLGLITFFTAVGGNEVRARSLPRGSTALEAAGRVHTDMQRGFVRAEVIGWERAGRGGLVRARARARRCCAPRAATTSSRTATC